MRLSWAKGTAGRLRWASLLCALVGIGGLPFDPSRACVGDRTFGPANPAALSGAMPAGVDKPAQHLNHPPLADAGSDQFVEADDSGGGLVELDASGSSDPDGDVLAFAWSWGGRYEKGVRTIARFPIGTTPVRLVVSDHRGMASTRTLLITVEDTTPPEVGLTSPEDRESVTGTINVQAEATDAVAVAGVQFLLDGTPLGPEDTWEPYEVPWNTRTAAEGPHRLAARARDAAGNQTTCYDVWVTVANGPVPEVTVARAEETDAALARDDSWTEITNEEAGVALGEGRAMYSGAAAAIVSFVFTGTGVRWIGYPCESCGIADVLIDGGRVATVDTFAPSRPESSRVMYTSPTLAPGSHTIAIEVTGAGDTASDGSFVVVDAFEVLVSSTTPSRARPVSRPGGA